MGFWMLLAIIGIAAVLFVTEAVAVDVLCLSIAAALMLTGLVNVKEGLSGFSSEATVTVAAFFVLAKALARTGAPALVAQRLVGLTRGHPRRFLGSLMVLAAASASLLHVTGVVAVYLPVVMDAARTLRANPSKFLIPLSYAAQFGGVCTLLGTTSNLVVSAIMVQHGMQPIGMFEITALGLSLFCGGFLYLLFVGWHLLPDRAVDRDLPHAYGLDRYLTELVVSPKSPLNGKTLRESDLRARAGLHVIEIIRGSDRISSPIPREILHTGDILRVKATLDDMMQAATRLGLELPPDVQLHPESMTPVSTRMAEAIVSAGSAAVRRTIRDLEFRERYGVSVLAVKRRGKTTLTDLRDVPLRRNDTLLLQGTRDD
ncbi:MAG: SLC13 family permease, partial [Armatimonadetes bacterium]|nr:SLC13 family permease [Armatimonadota bacterium]